MNIYLHELKTHIRSVITWSLSLIGLIILYMSIFGGFAENTEILTQAMSNFPRELMMAFGMEDMDWASIMGYFALIFLFVQICAAIQAANYGFGLVSIEETELTADFLLPKPVRRTGIITAKFLAALTSLLIVNLVVWATSFLSIAAFQPDVEYDRSALAILLASLLLFQLFFLCVGMLISLLVRRVRSVTPYSMALVFGLYIFNAFGGMLGKESLELISPFRHFDPNYILKHAGFDWSLVGISLAVTVLAFAGSYWLYTRRNILAAV